MSEKKCPFEIGDVVRHKASKQMGVVLRTNKFYLDTSPTANAIRLGKPTHDWPEHVLTAEYSGNVDIAIDFGIVHTVADVILEKVGDKDA